MDKRRNIHTVEVEITGDYALFSDPLMRVGGEKSTLQIPTYEALKGIMMSCAWKPTITWVIDKVRIMNPIQMEAKGIRVKKYGGGQDSLSIYTYLKNCRYRVRAHCEWNEKRPDRASDRNAEKYRKFIDRSISKGGRRDIFLGTRECQGYVNFCDFDEGRGAYDDIPRFDFGFMYHGIIYHDKPCTTDTATELTINFWKPVMEHGVITFPRPEECPWHKEVKREADLSETSLTAPQKRRKTKGR